MNTVYQVIFSFTVILVALGVFVTPVNAVQHTACLSAPSSYGKDAYGCTEWGSSIGTSQSFELSENGENANKARIILAPLGGNYSCTQTVSYSNTSNKFEKKTTGNCTAIPRGWNTASISIFKHGKWHFRQNLMFKRY